MKFRSDGLRLAYSYLFGVVAGLAISTGGFGVEPSRFSVVTVCLMALVGSVVVLGVMRVWRLELGDDFVLGPGKGGQHVRIRRSRVDVPSSREGWWLRPGRVISVDGDVILLAPFSRGDRRRILDALRGEVARGRVAG